LNQMFVMWQIDSMILLPILNINTIELTKIDISDLNFRPNILVYVNSTVSYI
jgi:hypothetical protein